MKQASPWLLPLLRSQAQGDLLAWLYLHPERQFSLTELASLLGVSVATVSREADRLVAADLLCEQRRGNLRLICARTDTPVFQPLADLLAVTYGPKPVLTDLLAKMDGITEAHIYGSWAARYRHESGAIPADVDVLVIGTPDPDDLFDVAEEASRLLGREVNIRRISPQAWADDHDDPFLDSVRERPRVKLDIAKETA